MNPQSKTSQEEKSAYWQQHIKAWNRSGLSQKHYCRSRALTLTKESARLVFLYSVPCHDLKIRYHRQGLNQLC